MGSVKFVQPHFPHLVGPRISASSRWITRAVLIAASILCLPPAAAPQSAAPDLSAQTLEQLVDMRISVSSFARKPEDLWRTPAAVYVISAEDIAQSAASSIPELLRMVPGLQVAQIDASSWAVTARGFNSEYASKLLVLIDGRTVYSEIYSGAHWDQVDLPLETIERIEVIRGPGAAVWGTNAVNGVINIITWAPKHSTGSVVSGHVGRIDDVATVRYGGTLGDRTQYRSFASYVDREPFELASGAQAFDGAGTWHEGGRIDWQKNAGNLISTSGDIYKGHLRNEVGSAAAVWGGAEEYDTMSGGFLLGRWEHKLGGSDTALQVYYDQQSRNELSDPTRTRTTDIDFQSHHVYGERHDVVWGSEFRFTADHVSGMIGLTPQTDYPNYLVNGFMQDEIALLPQRLTLTLGSKIQTGTLAGFQIQPSVRLLFAPSDEQSAWVAVSRAVVSPSLQDKYINFPLTLGYYGGLPLSGLVQGTPGFTSETVVAYEAGYRRRLTSRVSLDVASFFNDNHRIESLDVDGIVFVPTPPHLLAVLSYRNGFRAKSGGIEAALLWKPRRTLTFHGSYTWMNAQTTQVVPGISDILNAFNAPKNAVTASGAWSIGNGWAADGMVSHVGAMPTNPPPSLNPAQPAVIGVLNSYTRLDAHLTRKLGHSLTMGLAGTNLQTPRHLEFDAGTGYITPAYVPRSVALTGAWTF